MGERWSDGTPRMPPQLCHACGYLTDAAVETNGDLSSPEPGDVSICMNCAELAIYAQDLSQRPLTAAERADPELQAIQRDARRLHNLANFGDLARRGGHA